MEIREDFFALVMWYLPVTDRLRRIFLNPKEAALMIWWDDERKVDDDKIAHLADCSQWQRIHEKHKEFSDDPRKVWFGLSTDGMNPFNKRMSDHSTWPVILTMYNIPRSVTYFFSTPLHGYQKHY